MDNITDKPRAKRGVHPNSLANLKPFQNGNRANPNGRPKKDVSLTSLLKEEINTIPPGEKQGRTWRQLLVLAWLSGAMKNPVLMKELLDRLEGKVVQPVDASGSIEIKDARELTDEQLAVIAATNIIKNNASRSSDRVTIETASP